MRSKAWVVAVLAAAAVALAGCTDDGGSSDGSSTTDSGETKRETTQRACASLEPAEIEAVFGGPVGAASPVGDGICQWAVGGAPGEPSSAVLLVSLDAGLEHPARGFAKVRESIAIPVDVNGVGDDAIYSSGDIAMYVRTGDSIFVIQYFSTTPIDPNNPPPLPDEQANLTKLARSIVTSLESPPTDLDSDTSV